MLYLLQLFPFLFIYLMNKLLDAYCRVLTVQAYPVEIKQWFYLFLMIYFLILP